MPAPAASARGELHAVAQPLPHPGPHRFGDGDGAGRFGASRAGQAHQGRDTFADCGTPLVAAHGGTVRLAGFRSVAGNSLVVATDEGADHVSMHLRGSLRSATDTLRIMRLLILGGTVFLGRHVAAEALARSHEVTVFHRGRHGSDLFAGEAEHLIGDRGSDLSALEGGRWDAAVDTSGYQPEDVAASSALLAAAGVEHLAFVSTCNVYPAWPAEPVSEDSPVWTDGDDYGPNKAASEREAEAALPGRVAALRAGLLCGPHDNVFRLPWWVQRIGRGGEVLAPGDPDRHVQLIDARDLASWIVDLGERREAGFFNATSPPGRTTMREVLEAAVDATGSDARLTWVPDEALVAAEAGAWVEVPLWLPEAEGPGTWRVAAARAEASGLRCRPVAETVIDVWAWLQAGGAEAEGPDWLSPHAATGMSPERERELLTAAARERPRPTPTRSCRAACS